MVDSRKIFCISLNSGRCLVVHLNSVLNLVMPIKVLIRFKKYYKINILSVTRPINFLNLVTGVPMCDIH